MIIAHLSLWRVHYAVHERHRAVAVFTSDVGPINCHGRVGYKFGRTFRKE